MPVDLPDVNLLIALFDPDHTQHAKSADWFAQASRSGWATCPLTENGIIRIMSNPAYSGVALTPQATRNLISQTVATHQDTYEFWPDSVSLKDNSLFDMSAVMGHNQLTDVYLLGLCQRNGGRLVTLDSRISTSAIVAPRTDLLHILS